MKHYFSSYMLTFMTIFLDYYLNNMYLCGEDINTKNHGIRNLII